MQVLVVYCHPRPDSYCRALCESAIAGLDRAGHDVVLLDLYREGFRAQMNPEERRAYETDSPILDPMVARHAAAVAQAEAIVFVYPTWWWGLPALLKGWLDRVLVPGVAFTLVDGRSRLAAYPPDRGHHVLWIVADLRADLHRWRPAHHRPHTPDSLPPPRPYPMAGPIRG